MPRTIYLAVFSNGAHPAHQAVFIPTRNSGDLGDYGKLIHVTGNVATGFFLQFKRNYNFAETRRNYEIIPLATVEDQCIKDTPGAFVEETIARDRLESVATTVTPPGPSPKPFDPLAPNCQTWIQDYVKKLVAEGFLAESVISVLEKAPKLLPSNSLSR